MYEDRDSFGQSKVCVVCSDRALSCNFGAITCESCKAFFRRHAHKEIYGQCDGTCPVSVETRSYCRRCRLAKCFVVGMKKELILSEEQKQRRRQKIMENRNKRQTQETFGPDSTSIQQDFVQLKSHNDPSHMISPDAESSLSADGMSTSLNWNSHVIGQAHDATASGNKRDYWQSVGHDIVPDDHKRQAVVSLESDISPDTMDMVDLHVDGLNMVSSTNPLDSVSARANKGIAPMQPLNQLSGVDSFLPPVNLYNSGVNYNTSRAACFPDEQPAENQTDNSFQTLTTEEKTKSSEPCFFNLKPPTLDPKATSGLQAHTQHKLLTCVEAYREFCQPMVSIHDGLNPQDYVSLLNSGEECYRQLVRFAKRLPEFRALRQDDQIALLKANVIEIMIIRFSKCYNLETNSWSFPHGGSMKNVSGMIEDHMISDFCIEDYSNFVRTTLECCKGDDFILVVLIVITLFWSKSTTLEDDFAAREAYGTYIGALDAYLEIMYDDRNMPSDINRVMEQLRNVGKKWHDVMWKSQVSELHPLLKEMFDLR